MDINLVLKELNKYKDSETTKSWKMEQSLDYKNEYLKVIRLDSSNKWLGKPHLSEMTKMWSVIVQIKKDFTFLPNYKILKSRINMDVSIVRNGSNKDCYGIRIYDMSRDPNPGIVKFILDFIFQ